MWLSLVCIVLLSAVIIAVLWIGIKISNDIKNIKDELVWRGLYVRQESHPFAYFNLTKEEKNLKSLLDEASSPTATKQTQMYARQAIKYALLGIQHRASKDSTDKWELARTIYDTTALLVNYGYLDKNLDKYKKLSSLFNIMLNADATATPALGYLTKQAADTLIKEYIKRHKIAIP